MFNNLVGMRPRKSTANGVKGPLRQTLRQIYLLTYLLTYSVTVWRVHEREDARFLFLGLLDHDTDAEVAVEH